MPRLLAMIPARLGSKRIPRKNLRLLGGKPLLGYAIDAARASGCFPEIWVNSESVALGRLAVSAGAAFHRRPPELASDTATNQDFTAEFLRHHPCDAVVMINPTSPLLRPETIRAFCAHLVEGGFDTLLSVLEEQAECFFQGAPINFTTSTKNNSQDLTPIAKVVWGITAWRRDTFLALADAGACGVFAGRLGLFPVPLEESLDIDTPAQWHLAECLLAARTGRPEPASYWEVPRTECTCTPAVAGRSHPGDSTMPTDRLRNLAAQAREIIAKHVTVLRERDVAADVLREEGKDITLRADRLLSDALTAGLTAATGIACLSEEDRDGLGLPDDQAVWIVDPLDGSMNYSRGLPLYGISIALWQGGTPLLGIIRDVCRGETLTGFSDGSDVDGVPLAVRQETDMGRAMLATGFPVLTDTSPEATDWLRSFVGRFKKIRMLGSAALSLAWVAQGKIDAYFERDIMLWDVAAGAALVRGAGGVCDIRPGRHPMSRDVLAANAPLAANMRRVLGWA